MKNLKTLLALVALLPVFASAQSVYHDPYHGNVSKRQAEQHKRIVQGVKSGQLTHHEARGLHDREAALRARERRDRFFHGGHLTAAERARINRTQNHVSQGIYKQKHDAQVRHY